MFFNTTLLYALTITNFYGKSPLFTLSPLKKSTSFQLKENKFSYFFNHALKVDHLSQKIFIDGSKFSSFLRTSIFIRSVDEPECNSIRDLHHSNNRVTFVNCVQIINSTFLSTNSAFDYGGAISTILSNVGDYFLVDRCNFTNCKAKNKGGAIYFIGEMSSTQYNAITYCNFNGCSCNNDYNVVIPQVSDDNRCKGGSVYCEAHSVNFRNSIFSSSSIYGDGDGGAIYAKVMNIDNYTFVTSFTNCAINGSDSYGGAIYIDLVQKGPYNMSFMSFDNCNATNGQCIYATNISSLNINYTSLRNIKRCVLMVNNLDFNFSVGSIVLNDDNQMKLINSTENNYKGSNHISMNLYAPKSFFDIIQSNNDDYPFFDKGIISFCLVIGNDINNYRGYPIIAPSDASRPLEPKVPEVIITPAPPDPVTSEEAATPAQTDVIIPEQTPYATPTQSPSPTLSVTDNYTDVGAGVAATGGSGLSSLAIIFIVIACLIVLVAIIVFVICYLRRRGRCRCDREDSTFGVKNSTYF